MRFLPLVLCALAAPAAPVAAETVTVFAAASLQGPLDATTADWAAETGNAVVISYAGTAQLARQIAGGAPADIFIAASPDWMDDLAGKGLLRTGSRVDLLGNRLVLVVAGSADIYDPVVLGPGGNLVAQVGAGPLAMALVDAVPAGIYGKAALQSLGAWEALEPLVVQADNVRAALALVALGEAPWGIVYATDALAEPAVSVAAVFPPESHPPIVYPMAVIATATPAADGLAAHLASDAAGAVFAAAGFTRAAP